MTSLHDGLLGEYKLKLRFSSKTHTLEKAGPEWRN